MQVYKKNVKINFMNPKKKSVGIIFLSKDETGEIMAILQIRAKWNAEKNAPESWSGACQVTAHGKCEEGEDFMQALLREVQEELGDEMVPVVKKLYDTGNLKELINYETEEKKVITYGAIIDENVFQTLMKKQKSPSFGGFKLIKREDIEKIVDIETIDKMTGVTDENIIAMFPDEKEAVIYSFQSFGEKR